MKEHTDSAAEMSRTRGLELLEHHIPYEMYKLAMRATAAKSAYIKKRTGLAIDEWKVLLLIGTFAPLSTKGVAERSTLDKVRVSRTTTRLIRAGLATGDRDTRDRRKVDLRLTRAGKIKYRGVVASLTAWDNAFVAALDARALDRLEAMLQTLNRRIDALKGRF